MQVFMVKEGRLGGENTSKLEFCLHSPEKTPHLPDSVLPFCGLERFSSQQRKWPFGDICSPIRGRWEQLPPSPLAPGLALRTRESRQPSKHPPPESGHHLTWPQTCGRGWHGVGVGVGWDTRHSDSAAGQETFLIP